MNWEEFQIEKEFYRKAWGLLKADYKDDLLKFLNKSRLTVSCKWYFDIDEDLITAAEKCPQFFINESKTAKLLDIAKKIKALEDLPQNLKAKKKEEIEALYDEANSFDMKFIFVVDDWNIGPVFPTVDMDHIQAIKKSPYCDQERTQMRAYSINVVLKKII